MTLFPMTTPINYSLFYYLIIFIHFLSSPKLSLLILNARANFVYGADAFSFLGDKITTLILN